MTKMVLLVLLAAAAFRVLVLDVDPALSTETAEVVTQ
jgi:hypothetical protein